VALTVEIVAAGQLLAIALLDHLIIGQGRWISLKRLGLGLPEGVAHERAIWFKSNDSITAAPYP
jgi:hypothetical protein